MPEACANARANARPLCSEFKSLRTTSRLQRTPSSLRVTLWKKPLEKLKQKQGHATGSLQTWVLGSCKAHLSSALFNLEANGCLRVDIILCRGHEWSKKNRKKKGKDHPVKEALPLFVHFLFKDPLILPPRPPFSVLPTPTQGGQGLCLQPRGHEARGRLIGFQKQIGKANDTSNGQKQACNK